MIGDPFDYDEGLAVADLELLTEEQPDFIGILTEAEKASRGRAAVRRRVILWARLGMLGLNNGARALAEDWRDDAMHGNTTDRWLLKAAEDHDAIASAANRDAIRATTMRYLLAEVSP